MQQILIVGHLGQDCKIIDHLGKKFVSFSVAVNDNYKDAQGNKVERTIWYDCNMDSTGVADYLKKGTQVLIQGKPKVEVYQSKQDGNWYPKSRVAVRTLQLLGSATDRQAENNLPPAASPSPQPATSGQRPQSVPMAAGGNDGDDNDLPF